MGAAAPPSVQKKLLLTHTCPAAALWLRQTDRQPTRADVQLTCGFLLFQGGPPGGAIPV